MNFAAPSPDDTQPMQLLTPDDPPRRKRLWLVLVLLCSGTLLLTILWWSDQSLPDSVTSTPLAVVLMQNGQRTDVLTRAQTVADLLREQAVTLQPQDALSALPAATLQAGDIVTIARAHDILLTVDGDVQTIRTPYLLPWDILRQRAVVLKDHDRVWLDDLEVDAAEVALWTLPITRIAVEHALTLTVVEDGRETQLITTADTVGDALFEAQIVLYLADRVEPDVAAPVSDGLRIGIVRAQPLQIQVDGTLLETRAQGSTVRAALAEAGVALIGLDRVEPDENAPLAPGLLIRVIRVTEDILSHSVALPFETQYVADDTLPLDTQAVRQVGVAGSQRISERVRYEDGTEVQREAAGDEIEQPPTPQIIAYGTQIVINTLTTPDGPREYWRKLRVYATSYHPAALGGDNVTSIGETLRRGIVGADPSLIPYRTNLYVEGYGTGIIADTGGPRSSPYWIDLGYSDEDFVGWHRYVDIYLLTPVPSNIPYLLPTWRPLRGTSDG